MRILILFFTLLFPVNIILAGIIHVPGDTGTIQAGIDLAKSGDTILVANGTYTGNGNNDIHFDGKAVILKSLNGPATTTIDVAYDGSVGKRGFTLNSNENSGLVIEGMTIRNGGGVEWGGGIYINSCSPTFRKCRIIDNRVPQGGGVYITDECSPAFYDCLFEGNSCTNVGCGVLVRMGATAYFENCLFDQNYGRHGALLCYNASPTLVDCQFFNNSISGSGGAVFLQDNCSPSFSECIFAGNSAGRGGAVFIDERGVAGGSSEPVFLNCTFVNNYSTRGSCLYNTGRNELGMPVFENCIVAFNSGSEAFRVYIGQPFLYCSDIFGHPEGDWTDEISDQAAIEGNFSLDPLFCDMATEDFEIDYSSPCSPENNDCEVLIGALPTGCGTQTVQGRLFVEPNPLHMYYETSLDPVMVMLYCGQMDGECVPQDIDQTSLLINGKAFSVVSQVVPTNPDFWGDILLVACPMTAFLATYGDFLDTTINSVSVAGQLDDGSAFIFGGQVTLIGRLTGDANGDNIVDIGDPVFLLHYIFKEGRPPAPMKAGDTNIDDKVDIGDVVHLINFIFKDGPPPGSLVTATLIP